LIIIQQLFSKVKKKTGAFLGAPVAKPGPEPTVVAQGKTVVNES
jgi:hypothetical protein